MNFIDIAIVVIVLWNLYRGFVKGLVSTVIGLVGWFVALYVSAHFAKQVAPLFTQVVAEPVLQIGLGFITLILAILTMLWGLEKILKTIINQAALGGLEKMAGGALGAAKGVVISLALISVLMPWLKAATFWQSSALVSALAPYAPGVLSLTKSVASDAWNSLKPNDDNEQQNTAQ